MEATGLASLLKAEILRNKCDYRITEAQERSWAVTADRMLWLDSRKPEGVADLIRWVQRHEFWMANVLSMNTLREKFDQLALKKRNKPKAVRTATARRPCRCLRIMFQQVNKSGANGSGEWRQPNEPSD